MTREKNDDVRSTAQTERLAAPVAKPRPDRSASHGKGIDHSHRQAPSTPPARRIVDSLGVHRFHTEGMDEHAKRKAYLALLDHVLDTMFLTDTFTASMQGYQLGPLSVLSANASPRQSRRLAAQIAKDRFDAIHVQYIVSGEARGVAGKRDFISTPGTIMLLDYSRPFIVTDHEWRDVVNIAVPRALFPNNGDALDDIHGIVLDGPENGALAAFISSLPTTLTALPRASGKAMARVFLDLLAISRNSFNLDGATGGDNPAVRLVRRAERIVDLRVASPNLSPAWLAEKLKVSRTELYAALESFGGAAKFILSRRLLAARTAIESPYDTRRIGEIAFAHGFSTEAHFARSFRTAFGMTATEARHSVQSRTISDTAPPQ